MDKEMYVRTYVRTILKNSLNSFCIGVPDKRMRFLAGRAFNALVRPASAFFNLCA